MGGRVGVRLGTASLLLAAVVGAVGPGTPAAAEPAVCVWGGTVLSPTGQFSISPGLRSQPATQPLEFAAWGELSGAAARCAGEMRLEGQILPGGVCRTFVAWGRVLGVPGLAWFLDLGAAASPAELRDAGGNVAGTYAASVIHSGFPDLFAACNTDAGLTAGGFWAIVELV